MKKNILKLLMLFVFVGAIAQKKDKTLFKIDGERTYVSEFKRLFKPESSTDLEKNFDNDLKLMVDYKLKLKQSKLEGIDTLSVIKKDLAKYKKDLAAPFLTDDETLEDLMKEAYYRTSNKIKASHILISVKGNDTIEAYKKAEEVKLKADNGEDFGQLAIKYSDDKSALKNKGELGYFTAFKMVYPFEEGAYNTPVGEVSKIVRSRFGYHIIKVHDLTISEGKVKVAHIMIAGLDVDKKNKIDSIYKKLENGGDYNLLAKKFSDDKGSRDRGGVINSFTKGSLPKEFEKVAFSMSEPNSYSKPFKTAYGWHIIKFIQKEPVPPYEEIKEELKKKVLSDSRGTKPKEVAFSKMEAKNNLVINEEAKAIFENVEVNNLPLDSLQQVLFTINNKEYLQKDFADYTKNKKSKNPISLFETYKKEELKNYVIEHLEDQNDEYKQIITSYQNGLEIFELMKKHIWDVPGENPELITAFYNENSDNYKEKGATFEEVKGYVESDYQDKIEKEWMESLRNQSKIKYSKRQVKKLKKLYK